MTEKARTLLTLLMQNLLWPATDVQALKKLTQKRRYGANSKWWVLPEDEVVRCTEAGQTEFSHMPAAGRPDLMTEHGTAIYMLTS